MRRRPPTKNERRAKRRKTTQCITPLPVHDSLVVGLIIDFLDTRAWIQFSYTCAAVNAFKTVKAHMIRKMRTLVHCTHDPWLSRALNWLRLAQGTLFNVDFSYRYRLTDAFLEPLAGTIHTLNMDGCNLVTGAAFVHLRGIHTLDMSHCKQETITDDALTHLDGISGLDISYCDQITDAAFAHFAGLDALGMASCRSVKSETLLHLKGIRRLDISYCDQIQGKHLAELTGLRQLKMRNCSQLGDDTLSHLVNLQELDMSMFRLRDPPFIRGESFRQLTQLHTLRMGGCTSVRPDNLRHLAKVHTLDISRCEHISDSAFVHFGNIRVLRMEACNQKSITDKAFEHLAKVRVLSMLDCNQKTITGKGFRHMKEIELLMCRCIGTERSNQFFAHLRGLCALDWGRSLQIVFRDRSILDTGPAELTDY
jgi:hypothetical protein